MSEVRAAIKGLEVTDLHAYYGESHVLQGVTLHVGDECLAVLGRNGMGKTTLLRAIMGLTLPRSGSVRVGGREVSGQEPHSIAALGVGYVPQGRRLFPSLTVAEHLELTYRRSPGPDHWSPRRVYELFPELGARRQVSGARLSGGEQQMLAIGRALVTNPGIILLDEPSEGLSPVAVEKVIQTCRLLRQAGIALLLVEQNIHVSDALADRVYVMLSGRIVHEAPGAAFAHDRGSRLRYLGV